MRTAIAIVCLLCACRTEQKRVALRDQARLVLEQHCGACHIPESPDALPGALAVYNLREEEWAARMSNDQLDKLGGRIKSGALFDEFDERNKGKSPPPAPSEAEQRAVREYVQAELAHRAK